MGIHGYKTLVHVQTGIKNHLDCSIVVILIILIWPLSFVLINDCLFKNHNQHAGVQWYLPDHLPILAHHPNLISGHCLILTNR
jgi:hypothetical protein